MASRFLNPPSSLFIYFFFIFYFLKVRLFLNEISNSMLAGFEPRSLISTSNDFTNSSKLTPTKILILEPSSLSVSKKNPSSTTTFSRYPLMKNPNLSLFRSSKTNSRKLLKFSAPNNEEEETKKTESSSMVNPLKEDNESKEMRNESNELKRSIFEELDKRDKSIPELEKFLEKLEKFLEKLETSLNQEITRDTIRVERMVKERCDLGKVFSSLNEVIDRSQKELLEKQDETFGVLDAKKLKSCFGFDTFFARYVRRDEYGWKVIGKLRKPIEEVRPILEKKIFEATGKDVVLFFIEDQTDDTSEQVCLVELKSRMDLQLESKRLSTPCGYTLELVLCIASIGTISLMSGSFFKPDAAFAKYLAKVLPVFGGLFSILGVSEIATRLTAAPYGVKLSPSFLIPSFGTGFLGVVNNYESLLPNKKALFDIPVARTASAYLMSVVLLITSFLANGSFNGGANPLYVSPEFFSSNPSISFIQYVVGPYTDLGIALPYTVEGMGVPVDPLAFAGLLGIAVTSLHLLPFERLEGGRIAQALFGRDAAMFLSTLLFFILGFCSLKGNALCWACLLFVSFRNGEEIPAKDEITPLGDERYTLGFILSVICFLTSFPNGAGIFSFSLPSRPFF